MCPTFNKISVILCPLSYLTFFTMIKMYLFTRIKMYLRPYSYAFDSSHQPVLLTGCVSQWPKVALVSPLYKAKDPMTFSNYRPISLLPLFSKILEKLMYNRLLSFLNKCKIINKNHFGFRNNHPTYMALLILLENVGIALDNGECAIGVFLDFQKTFDTVDHDILLDKLYNYGIRGIDLEWFKSYMSNRYQIVKYNDYESEARKILCGVPQRVYIGPTFSPDLY